MAIVGSCAKEKYPRVKRKLDDPSGKQSGHADGIGTVPLTNNFSLHHLNCHSIVVVKDVAKENGVAAELDKVQSNSQHVQRYEYWQTPWPKWVISLRNFKIISVRVM